MYKFLTLLFLLCVGSLSAQCSLEEPLKVKSLETTVDYIVISGASNNDLADAEQGLCGVAVKFKHDHVGEMRLQLTSPSGQVITLMGPQGSFGVTQFAQWDILFLPCASTPSPDATFSPTWNNDQGWFVLGNFNGSYHPYGGCLESFNTGPVNGVWTVTANDNAPFADGLIESMTLFFCDPAGLECNQCIAEVGTIKSNVDAICSNDLTSLFIQHDIDTPPSSILYDFKYVVSRGGIIQHIVSDPKLVLQNGLYTVCGLSYLKEDSLSIHSFVTDSLSVFRDSLLSAENSLCAVLSEQCIVVDVDTIPKTIEISKSICKDSSVVIEGMNLKGPGTFEFLIPISNSECDQPYFVELLSDSIPYELVTPNGVYLDCDSTSVLTLEIQSDDDCDVLWITEDGHIIGDPDLKIIEVDQPGVYTCKISNGDCAEWDTVIVTHHASFPLIDILVDTLSCSKDSVQLKFQCNQIPDSFTWTGPNGFNTMVNEPYITEPGIYTFNGTFSAGCKVSQSAEVVEFIPFAKIVFKDTALTCTTQSVTMVDSVIGTIDSYSWTGPNGFISAASNPLFTVPGNYWVSYIDQEGCLLSDSVVLERDTALDYKLVGIPALCDDGRAVLKAEGADMSFKWIVLTDTMKQSIVEIDTFGSFVCLIESGNCATMDSVIIPEFSGIPPEIELIQEKKLNCNNILTAVTFNVLSNSEYIKNTFWTGPNGFYSDADTIYAQHMNTFVLHTELFGGCMLFDSIDISKDLNMPGGSIAVEPITCTIDKGKFEITLEDPLDSVHVTGPMGYTSDELLNEDLNKGHYLIEYVDNQTGCKLYEYVEIPMDTLVEDVVFNYGDFSNCSFDSIVVHVNGTYQSYEWTFNEMVISTVDSTVIYEGGTLFFSGIQNNGCVAQDSILLDKNGSPVILELQMDTITCKKPFVNLQFETNADITKVSWSGPDGFESNLFNPLVSVPGIYKVHVVDKDDCNGIGEVDIAIDTLRPEISAVFDGPFDCNKTNVSLVGKSQTDSVTYSWSGPNGYYSTMPTVNITDPGMYSFEVTSSNGCTSIESVEIPFIGQYPKIEARGDTLNCLDLPAQVFVDSDIDSVQYNWTGPGGFVSDEQNPLVPQEGIYIVEVTTHQNCVSMDTVFVLFNQDPPTVALKNTIDTITCLVNEVDIEISTNSANNKISWTGPNGYMNLGDSIKVNKGGIYNVTVIGGNNCITTTSYTVIENIVPPNLNLLYGDITCLSPQVNVILDSDLDLEKINWTGPGGYSNEHDTILVDSAGVYTLEVVAENGCTSSLSISIENKIKVPFLETVSDTLDCVPSLIELDISTDANVDSFEWTGPNNFTSLEKSPAINVGGIYYVTIKDEDGCVNKDSLEVFDLNYQPTPDLTKSNELTCAKKTVVISLDTIVSGEKYTWKGPNGYQQTGTFIEIDNGGNYVLVAETFTGCLDSTEIFVFTDTIRPEIILKQEGAIRCEKTAFSIHGKGSSSGNNFKYSWTSKDGNITGMQDSLNPVVDGLGTYILKIEDTSNGCIQVDSILVQVDTSTLEDIVLEFMPEKCNRDSSAFIEILDVVGGFPPYVFAREGYSYSSEMQFEDLVNDTYLITVKDSFGCVFNKEVVIESKYNQSIDLGPDIEVVLGSEVFIEAKDVNPSEVLSVKWSPASIANCTDCLSFNYKALHNHKIEIEVLTQDSCLLYDDKIVIVNEDFEIYVPNIFSPNKDGQNDQLFVHASTNVARYNSFEIYDRWGTRVYEFSDQNPVTSKGWDGTHLGKNVVVGIYAYRLEYTLLNGRVYEDRGTILLVR